MDKSNIGDGEVALPPGKFYGMRFVLCPAGEIQKASSLSNNTPSDAFLTVVRPIKGLHGALNSIGSLGLYVFRGALSTRCPYFAGVFGRHMSSGEGNALQCCSAVLHGARYCFIVESMQVTVPARLRLTLHRMENPNHRNGRDILHQHCRHEQGQD